MLEDVNIYESKIYVSSMPVSTVLSLYLVRFFISANRKDNKMNFLWECDSED